MAESPGICQDSIWGERSEMMLAHDIVGKKEEDIERQYNSVLKCIGVRYLISLHIS